MNNLDGKKVSQMIPIRFMFMTVLLSCSISLGALYISWQFWLQPPELVSFDLKGTTNKFLLQSAKLNLTPEQQEQLLRLYNEKLNMILQQRAKLNYERVIVQPAAIAGIQDITPQIRKELAYAMEQARKAAPEVK